MVENKEVRRAEEEDPEMLTSVVDRSEERGMMRGKEENVGNTKLGTRRREEIGTVRIVTAIVSIRVEITRDDYYSDEDDDNGCTHVSYRHRRRYEH